MRVVVDLRGLLGVGAPLGEASLEAVVLKGAVEAAAAMAPDLGVVVVVDVGSLIGGREEMGAGGALRPDAGGSMPEGSMRVAMGTAARVSSWTRGQERAERAMLKATGAGGEGIELARGAAAAAAVEAHIVEVVAEEEKVEGERMK